MSILHQIDKIYPRKKDKTICYLKNIVKNSNIVVGDFTFYHDFKDPFSFEQNVLYQYPCNNDKLIIGKFCSIASGTKFILNGGNHTLSSFSTYPFPIFEDEWPISSEITDAWDNKGDIVIGNDVWLGFESLIMPGVKIGDGAIIGARSVVTKDVEPYTIVAGSPARVIRKRFDDKIIEFLKELKWWNLEPQKISEILPLIQKGDIEKLKNIA